MIEVKKYEVTRESIIFDHEVFTFCKLPYGNRPEGCPNQGKCVTPLGAKEKIRRSKKIILFIAKISMDEHLAKNTRWYQPHLKKLICNEIEKEYHYGDYILAAGSGTKFRGMRLYSMEKAGIHVFKTLEGLNISIERNPEHFYTMVFLLAKNSNIIQKVLDGI